MSSWRLPCIEEDVWIAAKHALPSGPGVVAIPSNAAMWRVDAWLGGLSARGALLEIGRWLGEPAANGAIAGDALRARVRAALGQGRLVAFRREATVHAIPVGQVGGDAPKRIQSEKHALDFVFEYPDGKPASGYEYVLIHPSGKRESGKLGSDAAIHRDDVTPGRYSAVLKDVEEVAWQAPSASPGDEVKLVARVSGFPDGAAAKVRIFREYDESDAKVLDTVNGSVEGDKIEVAYTFDDSPKERAAWEGEVRLVAEVSLEGGAHWAKTPAPLAVTLRSIARAAWANPDVRDGDKAALLVDAVGYDDGTNVKAELWWSDLEGDDEKLADLAPVPLAAGSASFELPCHLDDAAKRYSDGTIGASGHLYAVVSVDHAQKRTRRTQTLVVHGGGE